MLDSNKILSKMSRVADKAVCKSSDFIETAKISLRISEEKDEIKKILMEIGEKIYVAGTTEGVRVDSQLEVIKKHEEKIAELTNKLPKNNKNS